VIGDEEEQAMTNVATKKPMRVSTDGTAGPYIMVPVSQLDEVRQLLDGRRIRYWVEENAISLDGAQKLQSSTSAAVAMRLRSRQSWTVSAKQSSLMALADELRVLRDRALADLNEAFDYYTDTKIAWEIVRQVIAAGHTLSIRNTTTGTVTTQADLAGKARGYVAEQLAEATFQQFISIFENFFLDLLRLWLMTYLQSLSARKVDFQAVLDAPDKQAITMLVVNKELSDVLYDRPASWFKYLDDKVKLGCPTPDEIDWIAEAKASRDVLVHNRRIASKTYESKAGRLARYKDGQRIDVPEHYHRETWELIRKVITEIANAAIAKVA
jgi:hypothetical protein